MAATRTAVRKPFTAQPATRARPARKLAALALAAVLATGPLGLAACASPGPPGSGSGGTPVRGGTAYFAEQPLSPPTYIFPLISGQYLHRGQHQQPPDPALPAARTGTGTGGNTAIDYRLSIGNPPVYSDGNRVVTITLKHYVWSDGESVSAPATSGSGSTCSRPTRPTGRPTFLAGSRTTWCPGRRSAPRTIRLRLNASYNPFWFTYNELSQITPLPIAWDRTSLAGRPRRPPRRTCRTRPRRAPGRCTTS